MIVEPQSELVQSLEFIKQLFAAEQLGAIHAIVLTENESTEQAVRDLGLTLQTLRKPFKKAVLRQALRQCHLNLRRTGEIVRPESQLKSFIASVEFATKSTAAEKKRGATDTSKEQESKILIVEDNPVNRRLVHLQLKTLFVGLRYC